MKKIMLVGLLLIIVQAGYTRPGNSLFFSDPCLSPDGSVILFVYEGDIWKVPADGGTALRLTAMDGDESLPRVSPDGKQIAFTGMQDGNANVYVVAFEGGEIKQLTFNSSFDYVDSWSWDSKYVYFTSGRRNNFSSFRVSCMGDNVPQRLFTDNYWNNTHFVYEYPGENAFILSESGESFRSNNRKRYKGENNPDIKKYYKDSNKIVSLTTYQGKDLWPTVDNKGNLYFASDEYNGEYNLYTLTGEGKKQLTAFESSIGRPCVSADGSKVVFTLDYSLKLYHTGSKKYYDVPVDIYSNNSVVYDTDMNVNGQVSFMDVSPDGKKIIFVSRGELFISDSKGKFIKQLETPVKERVTEAVWAGDNRNIIMIMTREGWPNIYRLDTGDDFKISELNNDDRTARMLSPDTQRNRLLYYSGKDQLRMVDLKTWKDALLVEDEFWFRGSRPVFSPGERYVCYTAYRHFEQDIFIYDLANKSVLNLTSTYVSERDPFWSPDGRYIYFVSNRTKASYPRGGSDNRLYRIPLQKFTRPFRSDIIDDIISGEETKGKDIDVGIDTDNILHRWQAPMPSGPGQSGPFVVHYDTVDYVFVTSVHEGSQGLYRLSLRPYSEPLVTKVKGLKNGRLVKAGDNYYAVSSGKMYKLNVRNSRADELKVNFHFTKNLGDEFEQMFYEVWTILAENYYDEKMHGIDWEAMRDKYSKYLPWVKNRNDLRLITNDMLGELNSSHMGFRSNGKEENTRVNMLTAAAGIVYNNSDQYVVERIISDSPSDNIDVDIRKGDRLVSVNGKPVDKGVNREKYFLFPEIPEELHLVFRRGDKTVSSKIHPVNPRQINSLLYDEWIRNNQLMVDKLSGDRVGYVYLKNMSGSSLEKFLIEMTSEEVDKDGLIVDLRYNTGGNIHDDVLQFLSRKPYLKWKFREGMLSPQPHFAPAAKPVVLMVNEQSLSDAEMTSAGFKELGLGTIVGTETYRWIIFTSGAGLVDGSFVRLPAWGCYTLDGEDLEFSGVKPDVYIKNTFTDKVEGDDPQLKEAVSLIVDTLK